MSKKPKRSAPALDMTAMVDVAFLLLTFFILTTTSFRQEDPLEVEMPSSVSQTDTPIKGLVTISIGDSGQVFIGVTDIDTRTRMLERAAAKNGWKPTEEFMQLFSNMNEFGVPLDKMQQWMDLTPEQRKQFKQPGMSAVYADSVKKTGNDLREWIFFARVADPQMRFAIEGDVDAEYGKFKNVISTLQDWDVNQYALITKLEKPSAE